MAASATQGGHNEIGSRIWAFDWYQNRWPWMTLKSVMALILRYLTEFGSSGVHCVKVVEDVVVKMFTFAVSSPDVYVSCCVLQIVYFSSDGFMTALESYEKISQISLQFICNNLTNFFVSMLRQSTVLGTSGYATMVHGRGCNPHRCTTTFANVEITSLMTS